MIDSHSLERAELNARMLAGWRTHLLASGNKSESIAQRVRAVEKFIAFTGGRFAWEWTMDDVDRYGASLTAQALSTMRDAQGAIRGFLTYLTHPGYDWVEHCHRAYGVVLRQLCTPENTLRHAWCYEGNAERRALTPEELQQFFDYLLQKIRGATREGVKGALTAARDYALFATVVGYGLRIQEATHLATADIVMSPIQAVRDRFGPYGGLFIRYAKAAPRATAKRRTVLTTPLFGQSARILRWYCEEIRPLLPASSVVPGRLFYTERGTPMSAKYGSHLFGRLRTRAGLPLVLTTHCLRHTFITQLAMNDYAPTFIKEMAGHDSMQTTAGYTTINDDYLHHMVCDHL